MEYITEIIKNDDTTYISITRTSDNNRWLCNPLQQCPIEDNEIKQLFIETFTDEIKDNFKKLLDVIM